MKYEKKPSFGNFYLKKMIDTLPNLWIWTTLLLWEIEKCWKAIINSKVVVYFVGRNARLLPYGVLLPEPSGPWTIVFSMFNFHALYLTN